MRLTHTHFIVLAELCCINHHDQANLKNALTTTALFFHLNSYTDLKNKNKRVAFMVTLIVFKSHHTSAARSDSFRISSRG